MTQVPRLSRRARWAVPAGALVITGGVIAGSLITVAQAAPGLPPRTAAQLLVDAAQATTPPLTGTVVETASLGLPSLPGTHNPTSVASLITGSHTVRVFYASPEHFRLQVPQQLSETDVIRDGSTGWLWESTRNAVTRFALPPHETHAKERSSQAGVPMTPQQAAQQVLAKAGKTTTVTVASNVSVAGEAAYQLSLTPKDRRSLVGQVTIAIDARNSVPLRVQVFARGASSPAFQVGYTDINFVAPSAWDLRFAPPPGAAVSQASPGGIQGSGKAVQNKAADGATVIGSGWLTVLEMPSSDLTGAALAAGAPGASPDKTGSPVAVNGGAGDTSEVVRALLGSAAPVHGRWGSGRLLRTSLVSVLITDSGKAYIGAVDPTVLYAAAGTAGK
ncbi:MAG: DUF2092 domain-containing protein [Streptosporangiaceae bacterium]|nr:DUF2092 domain-containing protein [Streptosporangiaceae bacterium]MBV9856719.1 DUF2092 domain-containing protein [Streptosporangiaceae bacterium]